MGTRKKIVPGDLVVEFSSHNERQFAHYGLVIGVDHTRDDHFGCEERIKVMFSKPITFETLCDCSLVLVDTLLLAPEEKASKPKKV